MGGILPGLDMTQCGGTHRDYQTVERPEPRDAYLVGGIREERAIWVADGSSMSPLPERTKRSGLSTHE